MRFSVLETPLVTLNDVSHVTLRRLTLEGGRAAGVTLTGGDHCLLAACTIRRLAGDAVLINGGTDHGVLGCDLYTLGRGGVRMTGGDRKSLTPGGLFVENCDIHDFLAWTAPTPLPSRSKGWGTASRTIICMTPRIMRSAWRETTMSLSSTK